MELTNKSQGLLQDNSFILGETWLSKLRIKVEKSCRRSSIRNAICLTPWSPLLNDLGDRGSDSIRGPRAKTNADIRDILRRAVNRLLFGTDCRLECSEPILAEASFARIIDDRGKEVTIIDELIAFEAAINFFEMSDPGLLRMLGSGLLDAATSSSKGTYLKYFSPALLIPVFHEKPLNPSLFKINVEGNKTPEALSTNRFSIVGCDTGLRGICHEFISMSNFLDAHYNKGPVHNSELIPPFFFPKEDIVFVLESEGQYYPVFLLSKSTGHLKDIKEAHKTICFDCIKEHLSPLFSLPNFCSKDIFFSVLFMPYHDQGRYSIAKDNTTIANNNKRLDQYTMIIDKNNRVDLLTKELLKILEKAKEPFNMFLRLK
ncbi:hypothetical protein BGZ46_009963, partial [Entomortierella lignicola]